MNEVTVERVKNPERFLNNCDLTTAEIDQALEVVLAHVRRNIVKLGENFPSACAENGYYRNSKNVDWTPGFWTGILWLCYENTSDDLFKNLALKQTISFKQRLVKRVQVNNHDLGFMYIPSCVAAYQLTDDQVARKTALQAANLLTQRYNPKGRFIQAWGKKGAQNNYRLIVDALMNIPLLQWAARQTGNSKYSAIANQHFVTTLRYAVRKDGSSYHTYFFDHRTGKPLYGKTKQGYSDSSSWARGQAWLLYGIPLNYRYRKDKDVLLLYEGVINYFLNRLPADQIPYWDLIFKDSSYQARDSSAAAIAVCGLDQALKEKMPLSNKDLYRAAAKAMLRTLIIKYANKDQDAKGIAPLLNHGVYSWHDGFGVDQGNLWGDYFYLEALTRAKFDWQPYW